MAGNVHTLLHQAQGTYSCVKKEFGAKTCTSNPQYPNLHPDVRYLPADPSMVCGGLEFGMKLT